MRQVAEKLREVEKNLSSEKGSFDLFALFLREDAPGVWDLVVAGEWIEKDRASALKEISKRVQKTLTRKQMTRLSRVVIIDQTNPALRALAGAIAVQHGLTEIKDSNFFGLAIKEAYIITERVNETETQLVLILSSVRHFVHARPRSRQVDDRDVAADVVAPERL